jgi:hypothetical protein
LKGLKTAYAYKKKFQSKNLKEKNKLEILNNVDGRITLKWVLVSGFGYGQIGGSFEYDIQISVFIYDEIFAIIQTTTGFSRRILLHAVR